jgi:hypothetical protein
VLGRISFLGDRSFPPYMTTADLCAAFGVGESTLHAKGRVIEKTLKTRIFDPKWTLPSLVGSNPLYGWRERTVCWSICARCLVRFRKWLSPRELSPTSVQTGRIDREPAVPEQRNMAENRFLNRLSKKARKG